MTTPPGRGATPREVAQAHGRSAAVHYEVRFKEVLSQEGALNASSGERNEARAAALLSVMREAVNEGLAGGLQVGSSFPLLLFHFCPCFIVPFCSCES